MNEPRTHDHYDTPMTRLLIIYVTYIRIPIHSGSLRQRVVEPAWIVGVLAVTYAGTSAVPYYQLQRPCAEDAH